MYKNDTRKANPNARRIQAVIPKKTNPSSIPLELKTKAIAVALNPRKRRMLEIRTSDTLFWAYVLLAGVSFAKKSSRFNDGSFSIALFASSICLSYFWLLFLKQIQTTRVGITAKIEIKLKALEMYIHAVVAKIIISELFLFSPYLTTVKLKRFHGRMVILSKY